MKSIFYKTLLFAGTMAISGYMYGQANTSLSNLVSPVAVSTDLTPMKTNAVSLGLGAYNWKNIYIGTSYYLKNLRIIHAPGATNFFDGPGGGNSTMTGVNNIGLGHNVLGLITSGSWNTGLGYKVLQANTTGNYNTAAGNSALFSNTTGSINTAIGDEALYYNTTGNYNTATAYGSLYSNSSGYGNTANGYSALYYNTTGVYNTAVGYLSMYYNTIGSYNTALGFQALVYNTTGSSNTVIGDFAGSNSGGYNNTVAIGYNAITTASNQVRIGNASTTSIGGYVGWSVLSDGRFKKNIQENVVGLEFINKLKAVTYNLDITGINSRLASSRTAGEKPVVDRSALAEKEKIIYSGFIAQDVEKAANETGYIFNGVDAPKNADDLYSLRYEEFVVPLVKAVQELSNHKDSLQQKVETLQHQNENLLQQNQTLEKRLEAVEKMLKITPSTVTLSNASMAQNAPNPFHGNTTISYTLPQQGLSDAYIVIYDIAGKKLKQINVTGQGPGTVNINAAGMAAGTYQYTLFINATVVDTKKMVLLK